MKTSEPKKEKAPAEKEERKGMCVVTFPKPMADKFGASAKIIRMRTICNFVSRVNGYRIHEDETSIQMILPYDNNAEDAKWIRDNVIRYVDIDKDAPDRVDKLIEVYNEKDPEREHSVSLGLIKLQSREIYMPISIWRLDDEE